MTDPTDADEKAAREWAYTALLRAVEDHGHGLGGEWEGCIERGYCSNVIDGFIIGAAHGRAQGVVEGLRIAIKAVCPYGDTTLREATGGPTCVNPCVCVPLHREIACREGGGRD